MNWVQPKFTDFVVPPKKKFKTQNLAIDDVSLEICDRPLVKVPQKKNDLVVNKKKIDEVYIWLKNNVITKGGSTILVLFGPPGCGKLSTLKILCSEFKVNLVEWLPQVAQRKFNSDSGEYVENEKTLFDDFIMRATRYPNVLNQTTNRLVVVKDLPNTFIRDPSIFHELLFKYFRVPNVHLAFVVADSSTSRFLFPDKVKADLNVTTINFNPITQKGIKDALKKTFSSKFSNYFDVVATSTDGDLRRAIATCQFLTQRGSKPSQTSTKPKTDFLDIFRGLGRILYSKRENGELVHDPTAVAESFITSPDLFLGMLQENYLHTFSSIHDIAATSNHLSSAELYSTDFKDRINSKLTALILASYSVATLNSAPIRQFRQLNKANEPRSVLPEFKTRFSDSNVLLDMVAFGRMIPSFSQSNGDLILRLPKLK